MKDQFMQRISDVLLRANRLKDKNMDFAYLWTDSRAEYMQNFLTYGRQLTQDEVDALEENEQVRINLQCSEIGKKRNFKSAKKIFLHFQNWQKINFCTRKKFKNTKNAIFGLSSGAKIDFLPFLKM